jgi:hypothetical protein
MDELHLLAPLPDEDDSEIGNVQGQQGRPSPIEPVYLVPNDQGWEREQYPFNLVLACP